MIAIMILLDHMKTNIEYLDTTLLLLKSNDYIYKREQDLVQA